MSPRALCYRTGRTVIVCKLHSPALVVHARGKRFLSKQSRASCNALLVQEVRNALFGKLGFAAANAASMAAGLSLAGCSWALNRSGMTTESRALRIAAK